MEDNFKSYDLKVGYSCNNRCKHCVIADNKAHIIEAKKKVDLSLEDIYKLIDENVDDGVNRIVLTGGEVTIRKDFPEIIAKCKEKDVIVSIQSNGRMFKKMELVDVVAKLRDVGLAIALHSSKAEIHDVITDVKGSFAETCQGIRNLASKGLDVCVKVVISQYNQYDLYNLVRLSHELGAKSLNIAFPHGLGAAEWNFDTVIPRYKDLKDELNRVCEISQELGIWVDFETIPCCIIPNHIDRISEIIYASEETICSPVGVDVFNWDEERVKIKSKGPHCKNCMYNSKCEGVWTEYAEKFGTEELEPVTSN